MTRLAEALAAKSDLAVLAHEINVRLRKAGDFRLSASLKLAEARSACEAKGVSFKSWVSSEIKGIGYPEATKLAKIGAAPEPERALADFRAVRARTEKLRRTQRVGHVANTGSSPQAISSAPMALPSPGRGKEATCRRVTEVVIALSGLPPPGEVVRYFMGTDGAVLVDEHIAVAARWLAEFQELWGDHADAE
jgi:hypothetical protein